MLSSLASSSHLSFAYTWYVSMGLALGYTLGRSRRDRVSHGPTQCDQPLPVPACPLYESLRVSTVLRHLHRIRIAMYRHTAIFAISVPCDARCLL